MNDSIRKILPYVTKPGRYLGNEINSVYKDKADVKIALTFPDVYEVGMSYLGFKILYEIINSRNDSVAERVYTPWPDMLEEMRKNNISLFSLETSTPLKDFDIIGFTLQHELSFTNIVLMLDYAGIPLFSCDRKDNEPLVIAGGSCCFNPEPLADIIDLFVVGEGEEIINEIIETYKNNKDKDRAGLIRSFIGINGIYIPSLYDVSYNTDSTIKKITPGFSNVQDSIKKRIIVDFENAPASVKPPVPYINIIHDRLTLEIMRGCARNCKFCIAGNIYKPIRTRSIDTLIKLGKLGIRNTGHDEISLSSLNTTDYKNIEGLVCEVTNTFHKDNVSISLPSLRIDLFSKKIANEIRNLRKPGLTFAPETGRDKLREFLNKKISNDEIISMSKVVFDEGWNLIKLYFMVGLPSENFEDVEEIVNLVNNIKSNCRNNSRRMKINIGVSSFVPKPHTLFQYHQMDSLDNLNKKINFLVGKFGKDIKWHNPKQSFIEAIFSRGDRKLAGVLVKAYKLGCKFDAWNEFFDFGLWQRAFSESGVDPLFYVSRERRTDEILPWNIIKV